MPRAKIELNDPCPWPKAHRKGKMIKTFLRRVLPQRFKDSIAAYRLLRKIRTGHCAMLRERRPPPWDFHILSQNGEDGIIDQLASDLKIQGVSFVEFGFSP